MPKVIRVTPAQVKAAKLKVKWSAAAGKPVSAAVSQIANAKPAGSVPRAGRPGAVE